MFESLNLAKNITYVKRFEQSGVLDTMLRKISGLFISEEDVCNVNKAVSYLSRKL